MLALTSGVIVSKHVNLSRCMQPSFNTVNLIRTKDPTNICIFSPIQIIVTLVTRTVYLKKQSPSLPLYPLKRDCSVILSSYKPQAVLKPIL